jgi:hypothetical protein
MLQQVMKLGLEDMENAASGNLEFTDVRNLASMGTSG